MRPTGRPSVVRTLSFVALAGVVGAVALTAYATFRIWQRGEVDDVAGAMPVDAVVVLGAAQYDGRPSPVFKARIDHAIALWRELTTADGRPTVLVMTGGRQEGDRTTEAASARAYAVAQGVPEASILMEDEGRSTLESVRSVARILEERRAGPTVFVSDRSHMLRVLRMAKDLGIDALGSPASGSPVDATLGRRLDATMHELGALAWYGLVGRPTLDRDP